MQSLPEFFSALADPTRLRLLALVQDREVCVCYLQEVLGTSQPKVSRHLAYLRQAGLVTARREGKWMHYRLSKLDARRQKILAQTLTGLRTDPQIRADRKKLSGSCCG